jgi:signal transduction histidine kinase
MTDDSRLKAYRDATAAMRRGDFHISVPVDPPDQVGALGRDLLELAHGLERRFLEAEALNRLNQELNNGVLLEEVLDRIYAAFKKVIPYDRIGFALLEDEGRTLRAHWAKMEYAYPRLVKGYSAPMAGSSLEAVLETGRPRILNDLAAYLDEHPKSASTRLMVEEGVLSSLTCPLRMEGKPVGFLFFSSRFARTYEDAHVGVFLQVADTVSAIVEKSRLYGELVRLNALKNSFLGMAAHDLRGPLANILSYLELLREGVIEGEAGRRDALADIERIAESSLRMVESLLDVTAIESGHVRVAPRPVPLRPFLEKLHGLAVLMGRKKGMEVSLFLAPELPESFPMDPDRIEQALLNLLTNALKFSRPGARVMLLARPTEAGGLKLGVHDEGPGLSRSARRGLFREFSPGAAKPTGSETSTGLGLAIVRRIMEAHNGTVSVVSSEGSGSVFQLELPAGGGGTVRTLSGPTAP